MKLHDSPEDAAELAALYVAGALPDAETTAFEQHLPSCDLCQKELELLWPVVEEFAAAAPVAPNPEVRNQVLSRVLNRVEGDKQAATQSRSSPLLPHLEGAQDQVLQPVTQRAAESQWQETATPGISMRVLSLDRQKDQFLALVRMAPGATYPRHIHRGPEHCLVLEGELNIGGEILQAGDYQLSPPGSRHPLQSTSTGCLLMITSSLSDEFD